MWVRRLNIIYHNSVCQRQPDTNSHLFDGHEQMHSISCNEWWGWLCAAHTLGCLSDSLSQWLSQNLPSCPFYVRLWIRHRPTLLKLFEIYSRSYATFSSSILGKKHLIQLPATICMVCSGAMDMVSNKCAKNLLLGVQQFVTGAVPSKGNHCTLFTPKKAHSSTLRVHITI